MPLYKTITPNSQTTVKIWKITESYEELMARVDLKPKALERVLGMKSELHQRGFLSVRWLLKEFGYCDADLFYDDFGKPHLKDGRQISISHSFNFSAVIISDLIVGIDVEKQRDKISVIAHKFIDYEFDYLDKTSNDYIKKLTVIWCVKESLYKLYCTQGLSFKAHCLVIPFSIKDKATIAWVDYKNIKSRYAIEFLEFEGFTCAYAIA
ncbi:4'-phosphopantetheinyl transferase family protein [Jejuia pallidilutea]|jgi:phosphopantetheinyl transferase|uniref:Phosphopantetheinyl transferase n=1 Tax=Jejuia pallidilutea TaxID=504487 RepID=A0A090VNK4_9FLAO|nr:4'-phosphopantetheinyl transferase family protein [Jejuia pallidilutea]PQV51666.1 phosphopantetheinyl transferase [Jejuia pallidilutea]GAL66345.1 siderophore (surfactin) biosynthesis regulatory protein [Jejuia pallidilutea]GAL69590.1 siderophore (surfactin) biosynthesis regulatory protein [Jejuia pallidilutea]GAL87944.1 siderophore (Surfactin) biosynthesis regulatory protein [Jejuia pallidilutea]